MGVMERGVLKKAVRKKCWHDSVINVVIFFFLNVRTPRDITNLGLAY